ncbi:MAG: dihydrofolate reductase family protein [Chitinophagaceae bacterium]|nr:dihydrofolate reductase family protein [Chitinophagaceae bacterium]
MTKLIVDITTSLDGFIAGTDISTTQPLGKNGELLHHWMFQNKTDLDIKILFEIVETTGAVILGNRMYSTAIDLAWKGVTPFYSPAIVVCHKVPAKKVEGFSYITTGFDDALTHARTLAGKKNIWIIGGANIIQQFFNAGLVDILHLHIAPVLLIQGTRLFEGIGNDLLQLTKTSITETPGAVHIKYRVK